MIERALGHKALALIIMIAAGVACSSDEGNGGGIVDGEAPNMVTDVSSLVFVGVELESTDTQTLTVMNVGGGTLQVSKVELVETTLDDWGTEFVRGDDWVNAFALNTDEEVRISVKYTPQDKQVDAGYIRLHTNAPRLFSKENVIFRRVPPVNADTRNKFWQLTEVQNIGQAPLEISDILVTPEESDFSISFPASLDLEADPANDSTTYPRTLAPGESFPIRIYFNPLDDLPSTADLLFYSNDPNTSEYVVHLLGNSGSPCLQLSEEEEINFGEGAIGYANNKTMVVENCSPTSELEVSSIEVCTDDDAGNCDASLDTFVVKDGTLPAGLPDAPAVIGPQETSSFVLTYTPEDLSVSNGKLLVASNDPAKAQLEVPIVGKGTDNQCPQAVADAKLSGSTRYNTTLNTIPLKTVEFRGTNSLDPDGTVDRYEWSIIQRPTGSTATLTPSSNVAEPSLFLDLAGDYVVELKVFDDRGTESCGDQALVEINATPNEDIHVQLVWDTPGDNDQTDFLGSDVDLHFLHPNGEWNKGPFDIYGLNTTSDWGTPGDVTDDPSLDIDDTDGAGPENINLDNPQDGLTYSVGVYYFSSLGFGPSYATIRIYIGGQLKYEEEKLLNRSDEFWNVGTIDWPGGAVTPDGNTRMFFP